MANICELLQYCRAEGILFFFDACRFAENTFFIKTRKKEFVAKTIKEIVKEMFSYADGATFSAKKDACTNIGGALLFSESNERLFLGCRPLIIKRGLVYLRRNGGTRLGSGCSRNPRDYRACVPVEPRRPDSATAQVAFRNRRFPNQSGRRVCGVRRRAGVPPKRSGNGI